MSAGSVLRIHQVLHAALHHAVRWQLLARNPADAVQAPRAKRRELSPLPPVAVSALMAAADVTPIGSLVRTAVMTGMRGGEVLGLRWRDVDLTAGVAHVQQTAQRIAGRGCVYRQPKTRLGRRAVALSPATVGILSTHRKAQLEARMLAGSAWQDLDLVFTSASGVHPKVVSERLGHASVGITLDTYSHVLPGLQATAAAQLDVLLNPAKAEAI